MQVSTGTPTKQWRATASIIHISFLFTLLVSMPVLHAQQNTDSSQSDKETIRVLVQQIHELQARMQKLESERQSEAAPEPQEQKEQIAPTAPGPEPVDHPEMDHADTGKTLLQIRGFGDVTFHGDTGKGDTTSFTLGQLDLFVTSDVAERFNFLSEIVFEADSTNNYGVDIERLLLQYTPNDYFKLSVGRYHTAIGYYNTAYHHSTWLQTATGRPFLFEFEDKGGILPIHNVGISATGLIPSGSLGLHYVAEVGNGRSSSDPNREAVQNIVDENNGKAVNFGLFAKPQFLRGFQTGLSVYHDQLTPINLSGISETILAAHAVVVRPNFEWLNEGMVIRHAIHSSRTYNTPGFYTQFSKQFRYLRPYVRYQYLNVANTEPVFSSVGLRQGPSVGLRFDPTESVALKFQYDYTGSRNRGAVNGLASQLAFTF